MTQTEIGVPPGGYENPNYRKFIRDMEKAGFAWEHYRGRFFYSGPAVRTDERDGPTLQEVMGATKVPLQRDNLAFDWIVYPR